MKTNNKTLIAFSVLMLLFTFSTSFAKGGGGGHDENSGRGRDSDHNLSSNGSMSSRGDDSDEDHSRGENLGRRKGILRSQDEDKINRAFDKINDKLNFVSKVIGRIDKLIENIGRSQMNADVKAKKIAILEEIKTLLQSRLQEFEDTGDKTSPIVSSLSSSIIAGTGANFSVNVNESGKGFFVVLPSGATAPTVTQVRAGLSSAGVIAPVRGNLNLVSGINVFNVSGLSPNTSYVLYFVAQDNSMNLSALSSLAFVTNSITADNLPPTYALSLNSTTSSGAAFMVNISESSEGFYVVLPNGSGTPTAAQVKAGQDGSGVSTVIKGNLNLSAGNNTLMITGLNTNTSYLLFFTAQDPSGSLNSVVGSISFSTLLVDTSAPTFTLSLSGTTSTGTMISVNTNETGTGYYVIVPNGSGTPSAAQVKAGLNSSGTVALNGSFSLVSGVNTSSAGGLTPNTSYIIFFTAADTAGNLQLTPVSTGFVTLQ